MQKVIVLLTLLLVTLTVKSQDIKGKWKVIKVVEQSKETGYAMVAKGFSTALFNFKEDHSFELTTGTTNFLFEGIRIAANKSKWEIDSKTNWILIGYNKAANSDKTNKKLTDHKARITRDTDLIIQIIKEQGKNYILMEEGGFKLEVTKIKA